jgi:hypothetical protein
MVYVALGAFVLLADRTVRFFRRRNVDRARSKAAYPLSDSTNWRQPSG